MTFMSDLAQLLKQNITNIEYSTSISKSTFFETAEIVPYVKNQTKIMN